MNAHRNLGAIEPDVSRRNCGGWMAYTPVGADQSIGVTAPTEVEARGRFHQAVEEWRSILKEAAN